MPLSLELVVHDRAGSDRPLAQPHLSRRRGSNPTEFGLALEKCVEKRLARTRLDYFFFFSYEDDDFFEGLIKSSPLLEILISNSFIFYWNFSSSRYPLNYFRYRWQFSLFFFPRICPFFESLEYRSKFEKSKRLASNEREGNSMQIFTFVHTLAIYRLEEDFSLCLSSFSEKKPRIICVSNGNIKTHFPDITFYPSSNYTYTSLLFHPILRRR